MNNIVIEPSQRVIISPQSNRPVFKVMLGIFKVLKLTGKIAWKITRIGCAMILMLLIFTVAMTQ